MISFENFQLLPSLLSSLKEKSFVKPTEIQSKVIPLLMEQKSTVSISETGSGKTLSYALPILHILKTMENSGDAVKNNGAPRAAVIVPTRELGEQVAKVFKPFTHTTRLRVRTVLGGSAMDVAKRNVQGPFEILIATPGRLVQLMDKRLVNLSDVRFLVFDEADQMLDPSFLTDAQKIADQCSPSKQLALFSATISTTIQTLITKLFSDPLVIRSQGSHRTVPTLKTDNRTVIDGKRFPLLEKVLAQPIDGGTLIFTNTRAQCDALKALLEKSGWECLVYRGEMDKIERRRNLKKFRDGDVKIMIATDIAGRGLDIEHVSRVINYHLPKEMDNYIHRVGRTARAGRKGLVVNFITERDGNLISKLGDIKPRSFNS